MSRFRPRRSYKKEFKRQLKIAIMAAIGFTIAFAWRESIFDAVKGIVTSFTESAKDQISEIYTAIIITIIGVAIIIISAKLLREKR